MNYLYIVKAYDKEESKTYEYEESSLSKARELQEILSKDKDIADIAIYEYETLTRTMTQLTQTIMA